jgi:hypothetical protein
MKTNIVKEEVKRVNVSFKLDEAKQVLNDVKGVYRPSERTKKFIEILGARIRKGS